MAGPGPPLVTNPDSSEPAERGRKKDLLRQDHDRFDHTRPGYPTPTRPRPGSRSRDVDGGRPGRLMAALPVGSRRARRAVEGKSDRDVEGVHDGEAEAVREADPTVVQARIDVQGGLLQRFVGTENLDDPADEQALREPHRAVRTQPPPDSRDGFVEHVV